MEEENCESLIQRILNTNTETLSRNIKSQDLDPKFRSPSRSPLAVRERDRVVRRDTCAGCVAC